MKKEDVEVHSEGYGRKGNPAVNVKYYGHCLTGKIENHFLCSEETAEKAAQIAFDCACELFWEEVQETADYILGKGYKVYSEGRSGGWLVVHNLPPVESWDAIQLGKWARFHKAIRSDVDYRLSWDSIREDIEANGWAEEYIEKAAN